MTDIIRKRPDGSIDTAHYIARGRRLRSAQAHAMARSTLGERTGPRAAPILTMLALAVLVGIALPFAA